MHMGHLRILVVHNSYQRQGGEDMVMEAEADLLRDHGHAVETYTRSNAEICRRSRVGVLIETLWSNRTTADLETLIRTFRPDVIHAHNIFPLISPSLYWVAARAGVPVVQTLHNFRLFCPQAMLLREGRVCEACLGHVPWRSVVYRCYRNSAIQSLVTATMLVLHRALGTWNGLVTRYIALNDFCRDKFIEGGLPPDRVVIKANFVDLTRGEERFRTGGIFVGRLSAEKGLRVLEEALRLVPDVEMTVIGEGPEMVALQRSPRIKLLGLKSQAEVTEAMRRAAWLVLPSVWYENFPRTLVEALACGLPVIASRIGALAELIDDGRTGLLFEPGDAEDLARKIAWAQANPDAMRHIAGAGRAEYEAKYTPEVNYRRLMEVYSEAISNVPAESL